jgi:sugar phosphate isomerase/epimerase
MRTFFALHRCLLTAVLAGALGAAASAAEEKGISKTFFPFSIAGFVSDEKLAALGYTPIRPMYEGIDMDKTPVYPQDLTKRILDLRGGTVNFFWLTVHGRKIADDSEVAPHVRELADVAEQAGVKVAIYPHAGFYVATARDALRLVKKVDRKNVGICLTLCHELAAGNAAELPAIVKEISPYLFVVTINGADRPPPGQRFGWDRLIQPLGQGDFDVYGFLQCVKQTSFDGPIGLQCYGLKGDPLVHLSQSIKTWQQYNQRFAAEHK